MKKLKALIPITAISAIVIYLVLELLGTGDIGKYILLGALVVGFIPLLIDVIKSLLKGNFGVDFLALLSIGGSLFLGEYLAGVIVVLMLSGGEYLEEYGMRRSRQELTKLLNSLPTIVHSLTNNTVQDLPVEKVQIGEQILIKPGETIPLDGIIIKGEASINESSLTGESIPVKKTLHEKVYSGTVVRDSVIEVQVTADFKHSKYQELVKLVKEAIESKAPFIRLADRYSVWFTIFALIVSTFGFIISGGDIIVALSVLVVATPCPLILATPIAFSSGVNIAAIRGAIFKSGGAIEKLSRLNYLVLDKTGTLTLGEPILEKAIWADGSNYTEENKDELFKVISAIEQFSRHILSQSLTTLYSGKSDLPKVMGFEEIFGKGLAAEVEGKKYLIGSKKFLNEHNVNTEVKEFSDDEGFVQVYVSEENKLQVILLLRDQPKPDAKSTLQILKTKHNLQILMLTGDRKEIAANMAKEFEIDNYIYEALPEKKLETIRQLQQQGHVVGMVGDGVNDSPALAQADIGIALGNLGMSASTDAADVVLTSNKLGTISDIIQISNQVLKIAKQGIFLGIGLSSLLMIFAAFGHLPPTFGALAQEAIDVLVIFNALRARNVS